MANFQDFYNQSYGKVYNTNGDICNASAVDWNGTNNLAGQCVSLIKGYLKWGGCGVKAYGNAIQFWTGRSYNGILNYCDVASSPQNGDIVVSSGSDARYGHIFIYYNGQAFSQNVCSKPQALLWNLNLQGTIYGYLRPKFITTSNYSESDLIDEHAIATLTVDGIQKRRDTPTGIAVESLSSGKQIEYTQKWVGNGHRYISFVEHQADGASYRYFVAVSGSETAGQDPWATFSAIEEQSTTPSTNELTQEDGIATFTVDGVRARYDSPTGDVCRTYNTGDSVRYYYKWVGNGHRYVIYNEGDRKVYVAVFATEDKSEPWATFSAPNDNADNNNQTDTNNNTNSNTDSNEDKNTDSNSNVTKNIKLYGVDLSAHNSDVDVSKYDYAIIRATWGCADSVDDNSQVDTKFEEWVSKCEEANIPYGVYCYDYALSDEDAKNEAEYLLHYIKDKNVQMGVWFDMEDADGYKAKKGVLTKERCINSCKVFCDAIKEAGYYVGIYTSSSWINNYVETDYPLWVANWGTNDGTVQSDQSSVGVMHQYTSTPLDLDASYHDVDFFKSSPNTDTSNTDNPTTDDNPKADDSDNNNNTNDSNNNDNSNNGVDSKQANTLIKLLIKLIKKILSIFSK